MELKDPLTGLLLAGEVEEPVPEVFVAVGFGSVATARTSRRLRLDSFRFLLGTERLSSEEVLVVENVRRRGSIPQ